MDQLAHFWLQELCKSVEGVSRAIVFSVNKEKRIVQPVAYLPEALKNYSELEKYADNAIAAQKSVLIKDCDRGTEAGVHQDLIACPLEQYKEGSSQPYGAVVVQMMARTTAKQELALQTIEASLPWFKSITGQTFVTNSSHLENIIELVACSVEHERFVSAATEVVTDLASRLSSDKISLGFMEGTSVSIEAISHSSGFDRKSSLVRAMGESMFEAIDQNCTINYPSTESDYLVTRCHKNLSEEHKIENILTVPFVAGEEIAGALMLERGGDQSFGGATIEYAEHIASLVGPILHVRHRDEQWLPVRSYNSVKNFFGNLIGPGRVGLKLIALATVCCLLFMSLVTADFRVVGDAKLEAIAQQVVVAPMDGYIAEASVRAGDIVSAGEFLGALDDKDLQLQISKSSSQLGQLQREYRDALAKHDRARVRIINARIEKVQAELNLIEEQLARTRFVAPFDGFIVSGDLSQSLGSPVERGQILFTTAPLLAYRVVLNIDERDIGRVQKGLEGHLVLSAMPNVDIRFSLEKITPVSIAEKGRNYFLVEAKIEESSDLLRPGMEGVGKIFIERRKLIWIVSHRLIDWLRLTCWSRLP